MIKLLQCGLLYLLMLSTICADAQVREGDKIDAVVAVVGKYPIFKSTIDGQVELILLQQGSSAPSKEELIQLRNEILQAEIDQKVLLVRAELDSLTASEDEIDNRIEEQLKSFERQAGSRENLERQLGKTVAEIKSAPDYRNRAREAILVEKLRMGKFTPASVISRYDVEEFYQLYRDSMPEIGTQLELASIIKYVRPQPDQKDKTMAQAKAIVDSLRRGEDFSLLAKRHSQHSTADEGGDLGGPYPRGTFLPDFESAAFKLPVGGVSDPVETDQGLHIIKLIDRKGEEIRVAQILLKPIPSQREDDSVKYLVTEIRKRASNGEDFGKLAREYSDDGESRSDGGYIGRIRIEEMSPDLRASVDKLDIGQISDPFKVALSRTLSGYQIIKLISRVAPHKPTLEKDYREIEATAKQWKMLQQMKKFVSDSRSKVYIHINDLASFY